MPVDMPTGVYNIQYVYNMSCALCTALTAHRPTACSCSLLPRKEALSGLVLPRGCGLSHPPFGWFVAVLFSGLKCVICKVCYLHCARNLVLRCHDEHVYWAALEGVPFHTYELCTAAAEMPVITYCFCWVCWWVLGL